MRNGELLRLREADILSYKKSVEAKLKKRGFSPLERPEEREPNLPHDITKLPDRELGKLFKRMVAWEVYAGEQLATISLERMLAEFNFDLAISREAAKLDGGPQVRRQMAMSKYKVRKARIEFKEREALEIAMSAIASRFEKFAKFCSREQTRRASAMEN